MEKFRRHSYDKAVELFQLCLLFHPDDSSGVKFRRSVQSHQATAYFHLNKYRKALEVGEKSYNSNPTFKSRVRSLLHTLSAVWIINFGPCEQIGTIKLWSAYHL